MGFAHSAATGGGGDGGGGWGLIPKPCDYCNSAQALLFCRTDSTYMCMLCDSKIHVTTKLGLRHERVWMCEVCEQAPASLTCKADAATLCITCDRDIHIASPLAQRHERLPVVPFYDTAESVVKSSASGFSLLPDINNTCEPHNNGYNVIDQWKAEVVAVGSEDKSIDFIFSDTDNQLDFDFPVSSEARFEQKLCCVNDGVVPDHQIKHSGLRHQLPIPSSEKHMEIDFTKSLVNPYHHFTQSLSQSVSSSSMDIGVVPEGNSMSEISYPLGINVDFGGGGNQVGAAQLAVGMDREARVLRYREKRKNRKFEKTIRYASRKAYAETRPRIKGRFAKRSEADHSDDVHQRLFNSDDSVSNNFFPESRYGVVPSF